MEVLLAVSCSLILIGLACVFITFPEWRYRFSSPYEYGTPVIDQRGRQGEIIGHKEGSGGWNYLVKWSDGSISSDNDKYLFPRNWRMDR